MPAEDPGDPFLRNRGAVLDTLLSGPSWRSSTDVPSVGAPVPAEADAPLDLDSVAAQRPAPTGPKASDRIMALLSGETSGPGQLDFTSDFSERAAKASATKTESGEERGSSPGEQTAQAKQPSGSKGIPRDLIAQLRKPKIALAVAGALALLLVIVLVTTSGGDEQPEQLAVVTPVAAAPTTAAAATPAETPGTPIEIEGAEAHCPAGSTDPMDAFSGQPGKAWACGRAFKIDGQVLTIELGKQYEVDSIGIVPGWDGVGPDGTDQWDKYRTVSLVSYKFDDRDARTYTQETLDQRSMVVTKISPPVRASKVTLTILQSSGDPTVNATAISSIVITGQ